MDKKNKQVLILNSDASSSTVADWYIARLQVTEKVSILGQTVLKAGTLKVVIIGTPQGTKIIMTRGSDDD